MSAGDKAGVYELLYIHPLDSSMAGELNNGAGGVMYEVACTGVERVRRWPARLGRKGAAGVMGEGTAEPGVVYMSKTGVPCMYGVYAPA